MLNWEFSHNLTPALSINGEGDKNSPLPSQILRQAKDET